MEEEVRTSHMLGAKGEHVFLKSAVALGRFVARVVLFSTRWGGLLARGALTVLSVVEKV